MRTNLQQRRGSGRMAAFAAAALAVTLVLIAPPAEAIGPPAAASRHTSPSTAGNTDHPFRTIITTDAIRFRFDDVASFYRLLLYSNEFAESLEGIVLSSSFVGPRPGGAPFDTDVLRRIVRDEYSKVYKNLRKHDRRYPSPSEILALIKNGNIAATGEMATDTDGSLLIKKALLSSDPRPLRLQVWGGTNTVAAALRSIEEQYSSSPRWQAIKAAVSRKAELYIILDQDAVFKEYIEKRWPELDVTLNRTQYNAFAYPSSRRPALPTELNAYLAAPFMQKIARGPLLENMPLDSAEAPSGPQLPGSYPEPGSCYCEGDSPAFFELIDNGLRSHEDPTYGGWGGRFVKTSEHRWSDWPTYMKLPTWQSFRNDGIDPSDRVADESSYGIQYDTYYPQSRWIPALQNEFAARAQWTYASYADANHAPVVSVPKGRLDVKAKPGQLVPLLATATDPDRDRLSVKWWQYREAGTYEGDVSIRRSDRIRGAYFTVPRDAHRGDTIHVILEVTDTDDTPITRYQRVIVTVK